MKVNELLTKAKKELTTVTEEKVIQRIKENMMEISGFKRTLKKLEERHKKFLESDIEDIEIDDFEY